MRFNKTLFYLLLGLAALLIGVFFALRLLTATITITGPAESEIYVKQGTEGFQQIGISQATFKTRSLETVYVEARLNQQVSQAEIAPKRRENLVVDIEIRPLAQAQRLASGPLIYPRIDDGYIYGINPNINNLAVEPLGQGTKSHPPLPLLPFLKKVVWQNSQNYYYLTLDGRAGIVRNSKSVFDDPGEQSLEGKAYDDVVNLGTGKFGLMASDGLFMFNGVSLSSSAKLAGPVNNSTSSLFVSGKHLYVSSLIYEEEGAAHEELRGQETILEVFNLEGKKIQDYNLPIAEPIYRAVSQNGPSITLLTASGLYLFDTQTQALQLKTFSFGTVRDLLAHKDKLLLLGTSGLWEYQNDTGQYYKVAAYPDGEEYVIDSLATLNGKVYFSTSISEGAFSDASSSANSNIYQLDL